MKQFNIRRSTQKPKQEIVPKQQPRKIVPEIQQKLENNQQSEILRLSEEIQILRPQIKEFEKKLSYLQDVNSQLEDELKKREKEINWYIDKIDAQGKQIKKQNESLQKMKNKKKDYKKRLIEQQQQTQQQHQENDPLHQILEVRTLLMQMRWAAQIIPFLQQQSRLRQYQTSNVDVDQMTYEQLLQLGEQIGNVSNGIAREDIRRIPKRVIQSSDNISGICVVCQCNLEVGDKYRKLGCNHHYHAKCIKKWLLEHNNCPVFKQSVININNAQ